MQSGGTDVLRMSFNTPGSRVDRELTTELHVDRQQQQVRLDAKTPWKKVNVRGSLVNEASLKKALLSATLDETTEYSVDAEFQVTCYNLARSEKFPEGLYILPTVSFFFYISSFLMISRRQIISRSTGPIFAIFTSNKSILAVDDRSGPLFRYLKGRCHGNRFCAKMAKLPIFVALAFRNGMR